MPASAVSRILVPVDFSPCSRAALDFAAQLSDQMRAPMDVLYVHEPSSYLGPYALATLPEAGREQEWGKTREDLLRELDVFLGAMRNRVKGVRVELGLPGDVIPDVAKKGEFDLIVMGTHGRGGVQRLVVGSVAETVMRKAPVPVLTLRMPKKEPRERIPL